MEASQWSLVVCILMCNQWATVVGTSCDEGWFGDQCQYKCRCQNDNCDLDGSCKSGVKCQGGWFGPACQYADIAYNQSKDVSLSAVVDGDDLTCLNKVSYNTIDIDVGDLFWLTWLRVRVSKPELLLTVQINFGNNETCAQNVTVDRHTLDLHCVLKQTIQYIYISGRGMHFLCSFYVSGGRNVALRQKASQSSTAMSWLHGPDTYFSAKDSVDGNREAYPIGCSVTERDDPLPHWNVSFTHPQDVNRIVLYIGYLRIYSSNIMNYVKLQAFDEVGAVLFSSILLSSPRDIITMHCKLSIIKVVSIIFNNSKDIHKICEVEVYGDSFCNPGRYGRDCEHRCNCAGSESCFVSSGVCSSGCAAGFQGKNCNQTCPDNTYGKECAFTCSQFCVKNSTNQQSCDHVSGACFGGCVYGFRGLTCHEQCPDNTYGKECAFTCSQFCVNNSTNQQSCDHVSGACFGGCVDGFSGHTCLEPCRDNTYGPRCTFNCSTFCVPSSINPQSCHHVSGACHFGCVSDYIGMTCQQPVVSDSKLPADDSSSNLTAVWAFPSVVGGLLVLVLIYVYMRCRGKEEDKIRHIDINDNNKVDSIQATPSNDSVKFIKKRQLPEITQQPMTIEKCFSDENEYATPADYELDSASSDNQDKKLTEENSYVEIEENRRNSKDGSSELYGYTDCCPQIYNSALSLAVNNQEKNPTISKEIKTTHGSKEADYVSLLDYKLDLASSDNQDKKPTVERPYDEIMESRRNSEAANSEIHDDTDCNSQSDISTLCLSVNNQETITTILKEIKTTHGSDEADYVSLLDYELDFASSNNQDEKPTV